MARADIVRVRHTLEPTRDERFEELFREHYPAVRAYVLRRAHRDVVQDVVAETFLVAWRRLEDVPDDALPWLYGVARRTLANQRRSARRQGALERRLTAAAAPGPQPPDHAERVGDDEIVRLALGRLSEPQRETLMLVAWDGLSGARAAQASGCSRAAFAVRLHRARRRLAAELDELGSPPVAVAADSLEVG